MRGVSIVTTGTNVIETVVKMYEVEQRSVRYISRQLHVDHTVISKLLKEQGIKLDPGRRTLLPKVPICKSCGIVLSCVAFEKDGLCCICLARQKKKPLGAWVWKDA